MFTLKRCITTKCRWVVFCFPLRAMVHHSRHYNVVCVFVGHKTNDIRQIYNPSKPSSTKCGHHVHRGTFDQEAETEASLLKNNTWGLTDCVSIWKVDHAGFVRFKRVKSRYRTELMSAVKVGFQDELMFLLGWREWGIRVGSISLLWIALQGY